MEKFHRVFSNSYSINIGFLCRAINFLEDVLEDSECSDILVSISDLDSNKLLITPINCKYDVNESINIFSEQHSVENIEIAEYEYDLTSFKVLYDIVINKYRETLHYYILPYVSKTIASGYEYYLGVLFNGKCFILEGEKNRVLIPRIPHCLSAHTHPLNYPYPSQRDIEEILNIFVDRGIGHIIVARSSSMAIYRVKPITDIDLERIKELENINFNELIEFLNKSNIVRVAFF